MTEGGNSGHQPNRDRRQKNIAVYIGPKGGALENVLALVCRRFKKTESQLMREIFFEKLVEWRLMDPKTKKLNPDTLDRLEQDVKMQQVESLPKSL